MGILFSTCSTRGIDVSQFNGSIDWSKVNCNFAAIREGYGRTIDSKFKYNWQYAKGKVNRIPYWYLDYYSNHNAGTAVSGMSDADWGKEQAENCWNSLKSDPEGIVFLDIENGNGSYAPALSAVANRAQTIAKAFLQRMDELNGKTNGIYCSLGLLDWFGEWFKDRPLWVAWYNEAQTKASVIAAVRAKGWTGIIPLWQYASDGDVNDDGVADGISMGMQYSFLDLNWFIGTADDYYYLFGTEMPVIEEPEDDEPDIPIEEEPETGEYVNYVVGVPCLNLRSKPYVSESTLIGKLFNGMPLKVSKTMVIDDKTWLRFAVQGWWACQQEGDNIYAVEAS